MGWEDRYPHAVTGPVFLRCEAWDATRPMGSLEGCSAPDAAGPSPFEGR
ncbi:hypothetical protein PMI42_01979 [Bradyrhizobium sp. YR681]|nr:hypothetical protein PMI42_01979 [Bradyrhizobium sp. YR681]